ncbi:FUSC family protein [Paraburkholderia sp. A3BS-1L]|uniref:FUSC family protein n=1 Tax=Paraburkholderia sp. A3BS-1L TaxID=3028375 RepID=UPI003DA872BE
MSTPPAICPQWYTAIISALRQYLHEDKGRLIHVLKTVLAVLLSTGISMRLELAAPRTAMVSVVILMMHQHSGMVMARGFYRGLGMVVGNLAALLLFALFPQERVLFLAVLSVWIGLCVWGAASYRNYQSYGFVLAGYATCIAALPAIDHPYGILDNVVTGLSEVSIGILCASLVSALIFPLHVRDMLLRVGASHFSRFLGFMRTALTGKLDPLELGRIQFAMIAERAQLENLRSAAVFEDPDLRLRNDIMTRMASEFLDVAARFHLLYEFRRRLRASARSDVADNVDALFAQLAALLSDRIDPARPDLEHLRQCDEALTVLLDRLPGLQADQRHALMDKDAAIRQLAESAVPHLENATVSLRAYLRDFIALRAANVAQDQAHVQRPVRIVTTANRMVAIAAGFRASCAIGAVSLFWIATGWTGASGAVISAAIASALYSIMPAPAAATRQMVAGCGAAWLASLFFNFFVLPRLDGFVLLAAAIAPFIMIGSYLNSWPKTATIGLGFNIYFCFLSNLTNPSIYSPTSILDAGFSAMLGIAAASLAYSVVAPYAGEWVTGLYLRQLRKLVAHAACDDPLDGLRSRFDSGVRDFVQQIGTRPETGRYSQAFLHAWSFASIEIGRGVIDLRELARGAPLPASWRTFETDICRAVAQAFTSPGRDACLRALNAVEAALSAVTPTSEVLVGSPADIALVRLRSALNTIRLSLQDNLVPLGDMVGTTQ